MARLQLIVLGSAAGGGVPQWNCRCRVCELAWARDPRVRHRTQSSIAVSRGGDEWSIIDCAPEILAQIGAVKALQPRAHDHVNRGSPIRSVLLTNGDIDHVAGALSLREQQPFTLNATAEIHHVLRANSVFGVLADGVVKRTTVELDAPFPLLEGVEARVFAVPGKSALYLEGDQVEIGGEGEATVGVEITADGVSAYYVPGCAHMSEALANRLRGAAVVLFDGTLWHDDEMIEAGVGTKTGHRMGHMSISGEEGSMAAFASLGVRRKIYSHINNTNPVLIEGSREHQTTEAAGWEIAHDGMEIEL
jgi:pyrroloquinoline quinone biosynthesis protein B